jgi:hypothetical protein
MIWMPTLFRIVSVRERFALTSMNTPPRSWNGFEKGLHRNGPSPISSTNHLLSGLMLVSETFRHHGASTASARSFGGV